MTDDLMESQGVTLWEVNRNVRALSRRLDAMTTGFVTMTYYTESHGNLARRVEELEREQLRRRAQFVTSMLYPLLILIVGAAIGLILDMR